MMKMKEFIKVPTNVVRNEGVDIDSGTFVVYVKLCALYFKQKSKEVEFNHKWLADKVGVKDTRTLRKRLKNLYENDIIKTDVKRLPSYGLMSIEMNEELFEKGESFTMLDSDVSNLIGKVHETSIRLLFFYKSHINVTDKDRLYCFAGREHITDKLHIGNTTLTNCNKELEKRGLLKVVRHNLETTYEYGEEDELLYARYQNHYFVNKKIM